MHGSGKWQRREAGGLSNSAARAGAKRQWSEEIMSTYLDVSHEALDRILESTDPVPNAVGRDALVSPDGCVVHLESSSRPRLMWCGEDLLEVKMPAGTRVVYPKPTIPPLRDRLAAIRYALGHPEGMEPLEFLLKPGMKVTIAIDDISLPLPPMKRPDIRESVLTILLEMLAAKGIEDLHIIIATSFHRRMTAAEIQRAVGSRIFHAYYPHRLYNHDGEAPDGMLELGVTDHGEHVRINRLTIMIVKAMG